jgi:quinol---cytochrome c reductase iron-sulfur subunit, bacillus type
LEPHHDHPHVPGPSLWPAGLAVGIIVLLVGLVVSWSIVAVGAVIAVAFAFLWVRDAAGKSGLTEAPAVEPELHDGRPRQPVPPAPPAVQVAETYPRAVFLELSTLGIGGLIGGLVTLPALGFMILPAFLKQGIAEHDLGPLSDFPEGEFVVATFASEPQQGTVSRRTAFVRNNGFAGKVPSFTIISNHCAHLGCPVQPNGETFPKQEKTYKDVTMIPSKPSGFGCPCHGGQYDTEGNRIGGPPVRALDRYSFSVRDGHLFLGAPFSVSYVQGTGAQAKIHKWALAFPGEHVSGIESWLYPIQPPH